MAWECKLYSPEDVDIIPTPWVVGRQIQSYLGAVHITLLVDIEAYEEGEAVAEWQARYVAGRRGANALAQPQVQIDPFGDLVQIDYGASAFELRPYPERVSESVILPSLPPALWWS